MKLRLQSNSIRLRLKRSEVERLAAESSLEEVVVFGSSPDQQLRYVLESSYQVAEARAAFRQNQILVQLPAEDVRAWAEGDEVGMEISQPIDDQAHLHVLIEKDFACLDRSADENVDTFPNPLAGTKC